MAEPDCPEEMIFYSALLRRKDLLIEAEQQRRWGRERSRTRDRKTSTVLFAGDYTKINFLLEVTVSLLIQSANRYSYFIINVVKFRGE